MTHAELEDLNEKGSDPDSRVSILETTYGLLGSTPFDKLSMQRIAACSGVSKALLFYFFTSKRQLVREALLFGTKREMEAFHSFIGNDEDGTSPSPSIPFHEILSHWMRQSLDRIQIIQTFFEVADFEDPDDEVNVELRSMFGHIIGFLENVLRENGLSYPREQAALLAVMIDTFGLIPHLTSEPFDAAQYRTALLDLFQFPRSENRSHERSENHSDERSDIHSLEKLSLKR